MRRGRRVSWGWIGGLLAAGIVVPAAAQSLQYPDPSYNYLLPAGGQVGTRVSVEIGALQSLTGATELVVEGPPGVRVVEFKAVAHNLAHATLDVAADAAPGRRLIRVAGGSNGLTNARPFFVGRLPEIVEPQAGDAAAVFDAPFPGVVNGRIHPALDVDEYRFTGKQGQTVVAAILAHRMDAIIRSGKSPGFLDTSLELRDAQGKVLAAADDTLGVDPVIEAELPADGMYIVKIQSLAYQGAVEAVYRLVLSDAPYPTVAFPCAVTRGQTATLAWSGPFVPPGTPSQAAVAPDLFPIQYVSLPGPLEGLVEIPVLRRDGPVTALALPPADKSQPAVVTIPAEICSRFEQPDAGHWYQVELAAAQTILIQTTAQRHLGSPIDTVVEVFDPLDRKVAENDDGRPFVNECLHDFESADSWLAFTAASAGKHLIRVRDAAGAAGPRAVYALSITRYEPDLQLFQWPDVLPVWGPGTSAACVVNVMWSGGLHTDVELRVEGLPEGWTGSVTYVPARAYPSWGNSQIGIKSLVVVTAPASAAVGTRVPFHVVGRAVQDGKTIERRVQPLTLLGNSHNDRMHLRYSPQAYAVVAGPLDSRLETSVREVTAEQGGTVQIPVKLIRAAGSQAQMGITVDGQTPAAGCAWQPPFSVAADQTDVVLPFKVNPEYPPGIYTIVVSRSWASDLRGGRPGPCTPAIRLTVTAAAK